MKNPLFRNTEFIKAKGPKFLQDLGYIKVGFEALDADLIYGGKAWFQAMKKGSPLIYTIQLRKQGNSLKWLYERVLNPEDATTNTVRES